MKINKQTWILGAIVLFALIIRIFYINSPLWYDEACSWFSARQSFPDGIFHNLTTLDLQHTPLYFAGLHFWMNLFGDSEIILRIFSLIFGILSVYLTCKISYKLTQNKIFTGLIGHITAVNPVLVVFSVEVRMYSVAIFLVLLSLNYLIDFEKKNDTKSLLKLTISNILLPYTYVGAIFFNIILFLNYRTYLKKTDSDKLKKYLKFSRYERLALIPYFVLIAYYAIERNKFVVAHEEPLKFFQIIDIIRNFFGTNIVDNIYWPSTQAYEITAWFAICVIVPCLYFIYGYFRGFGKSDKFTKTLYLVNLEIFAIFVLFSYFQIYILTVRYICYILPLSIILAILGLSKVLNKKHLYAFIACYIALCTVFTIGYSFKFKKLKDFASKAVMTECRKLELTPQDIVILPFGGDAPYYFRKDSTPRVFVQDFHKLVRNPHGIYYDRNQQNIMADKNKRYELIFNRINEDSVFSQSFYEYFMLSVNATVNSGRYVLIAMYGPDNNALKPIEQLRGRIQTTRDIKNNIVGVMFQKYLCDIVAMLNMDFKFIKSYQKDNYTYYLFQKI